jgi:hypothetical protein
MTPRRARDIGRTVVVLRGAWSAAGGVYAALVVELLGGSYAARRHPITKQKRA